MNIIEYYCIVLVSQSSVIVDIHYGYLFYFIYLKTLE